MSQSLLTSLLVSKPLKITQELLEILEPSPKLKEIEDLKQA